MAESNLFKHWVFVTYTYTLDQFKEIVIEIGNDCKYCIFQLEYDVDNDFPYINGYIVFNRVKSEYSTQSLLRDFHAYVNPARGSPRNFALLCSNPLYRYTNTEFVEIGSMARIKGSVKNTASYKSIPEIYRINRAVNGYCLTMDST